MRKLEDAYLHKGLRRQLVQLLQEKGITDEKVLSAIGNIPRHFFLDSAFDKIAYEDRAFPIAANQTISQPYTVAYQTQLLQIKKGEKVLEIGTGSMYQTTVLAEMGARVFTIERQKQLFDQTSKYIFKENYPDIQFFFGDGFEGLPHLAPFDKILITAAAPSIPEKLWEQLKVRGQMVIPVDESETAQRMLRLTKKRDGSAKKESFDEFSFVPMLQGKTHK
ncbi:MAG: protein-L-isoaspartate(D-aspartate) O-methyltransferase [Chitinophagia bacterium]|jgi:protein-L-isoaspartate(D-aspartate) O-methyltransferase|nr:protein-L-isoaspartate(D-aspartate) O-methyltransferase [Chitinophagia bacterium]